VCEQKNRERVNESGVEREGRKEEWGVMGEKEKGEL
jgi:hypothetical protein